MTRKFWLVFFVLALLVFAFIGFNLFSTPPASAAQNASKGSQDITGAAPQSFYPQTRYEFEPVMEGTQVKHDFMIENRGNAPLIIQNVRSD
jgi:hypothetical protein